MTHSDSVKSHILSYIDTASGWLKAIDISTATGYRYKTTIDALNALQRTRNINRHGAKRSALWGSTSQHLPYRGVFSLEAAWHGRPTPTPRGGVRDPVPAHECPIYRSHPQSFPSNPMNKNFFSAAVQGNLFT